MPLHPWGASKEGIIFKSPSTFHCHCFTCDFSKLLQDLLFRFVLGYGANKEPVISNGYADSYVFARPYFTVVTLRCWGQRGTYQQLPNLNLCSTPSSLPASSDQHTSFTASWAASLVQKVMKAYPRFSPLKGSIISLRSHMGPAFSNCGTSSSSNKSLGILPTNIWREEWHQTKVTFILQCHSNDLVTPRSRHWNPPTLQMDCHTFVSLC